MRPVSPGHGAGRPGRWFSAARAFWDAWWKVILLGVLTVGSYGLGVYAFGVMIGPIHDATGWSVGSLSAAFTVSSLIGGFGGAASGWLLDRFGGRPILLGSLVIGSAFLFLAASAQTLPLFIAAWGIGGGVISAGLFYNVTMALTARLFPGDRVRAFAILTFVGGFAAVLYFPLAGLLVDLLEWRLALRILIVLLMLHVLPAALLVSGGAAAPRGHEGAGASPGDFGGVLEAFRSREVLQMIAMFAFANMAFAAISVHQVPAMRAAGVSLGTATAVASARGFLSLPGRAFMEPVTRRLGVAGATGTAYVFMAAGLLPLAIGGGAVWLFIFTVVTGLAFGTISPLHGLFAAEVYGIRRIGTLMGVQSLIGSVFAASGPFLIGLTVDATDGYRVAIILMSALFSAALALLLTRPRRGLPGPVVAVASAK